MHLSSLRSRSHTYLTYKHDFNHISWCPRLSDLWYVISSYKHAVNRF